MINLAVSFAGATRILILSTVGERNCQTSTANLLPVEFAEF